MRVNHSIWASTKATRLTALRRGLVAIGLALSFAPATAFAQAVSFGPAVPYDVGVPVRPGPAQTHFVAVGDLNRDGMPDLAVAIDDSAKISILLGAGGGAFGAATTLAVGSSPRAVAISDINNDGKPDLAVANAFGKSVSIFLGKGDGSFVSSPTVDVGAFALSLAIGDFDANGRPDLAVARTEGFAIFFGNGDGTFGQARPYNGGDVRSVAVADLDRDGDLDIALAISNPRYRAEIWLGDGKGAFGQRKLVSTTAVHGSVFLAIGDFNIDGKPDLAVANGPNHTISIHLGIGDGTFTEKALIYQDSWHASFVATADLNADRKLDLVVSGTGGVAILRGLGDGSFEQPTRLSVGARGVAIADLNCDGKLDLAAATPSSSSNKVTILPNNTVFDVTP